MQKNAMMESDMIWQEIDLLMAELVNYHQEQVLKLGRRIIPRLTPEDVLQPNDYPELENNPHFRYEEGMLSGIQTAQMAIRALNLETTVEDNEMMQDLEP